jgi:hypothetical protein
MTFRHCGLSLLAVTMLGTTVQAQSVVKVQGTQGNWQLTVNGQPYYIKGFAYGPDLKTVQSTTDAYVADLAATGANTARTWGTGADTASLLSAANKSNTKVIMGLWLNQNVNYCTAQLGNTKSSILRTVNNYKNDPAVLMWDIGNEVILMSQNYFSGTTLENNRVCYAKFVNDVSKAIHAADLNHPTTSTEAEPSAWNYFTTYTPDLDLLALNRFGDACSMQAAWAAGPSGHGPAYNRPYIFTEFGNYGDWEAPLDSNGIPLEPTDLQKAASYPNVWACLTGSNGNGAAGVTLGGTAFIYGNANDYAGVWYNNEHTSAMTKRLAYFAQYKMFHGFASVANQPPACQSMTLSQTANVKAGTNFTVTTNFVDPDADAMTFSVMQNSHAINGSTTIANASFTKTGPQTFSVKAPATTGVWKIYVYAFDGHNNVGIETRSVGIVP